MGLNIITMLFASRPFLTGFVIAAVAFSAARFCMACDTQLEANHRFCTRCGAVIEGRGELPA